MFDIKTIVNRALSEISGVTVSDTYPNDFNKLPHISFYEIANSEGVSAIPGRMTETNIQVDIWHKRSTGALAKEINEKLNAIGLRRVFAGDIPDPSGIKHKTMRFHGVVDSKTLLIYQ